jgi:hypothetical protein
MDMQVPKIQANNLRPTPTEITATNLSASAKVRPAGHESFSLKYFAAFLLSLNQHLYNTTRSHKSHTSRRLVHSTTREPWLHALGVIKLTLTL